jgi:hypothetical protein
MRHKIRIDREIYRSIDLYRIKHMYLNTSHYWIVYSLCIFQLSNGLIRYIGSFDHVQAIRCDIKLGSVARFRDVEMR